MKIFSTYNLIARIFPTIIGLIPFFIFQYLFLNNLWSIDSLIASAVGNVGLSTILLYAFNQYFVRIPSKIFEDFLFRKQLYFPTTNLLMYSDDEYSSEFKDQIRESVNKDFSIQLPTAKEESDDEKNARKRIKDSIRVIIGKVKDGYLVLQHNIEYGFVRNLWGASLVGLLGSTLLLCISAPASPLFLLGKILAIGFGVYLMFGFLIIKYVGHQYARKLIEEYYKTSHEN
jgi:hypothetical protein